MKLISKRLVLLIAFFLVIGLLPGTVASAQVTAAKSCTLTGSNLYTCIYTITPGVATGTGDWIVQMDPTAPGTFSSPPVVSANLTSGCNGQVPGIGAGANPGPYGGPASYDVTIGNLGCTAAAVVAITETIAVTATGQICQRIWVVAMAPYVQSCASVTYTAPVSFASKICLQTAAQIPLNQFTCIFTIAPGVALSAGNLPVQIISGPGTFVSLPTTVSATGCLDPLTISPGTFISPSFGTAYYDVTIGPGGCSSSAVITVTETVVVTASGQLCQEIWLPGFGITACGPVTFVPPTTSGPSAVKTCTLTMVTNIYSCTYTITPGVATAAGVAWLVQMVSPGPGTFTSPPPTVSTATTGCGSGSSLPTVTAGTLINSQLGLANYDVTIGSAGCTAQAVVVINETVTVTSSGQICQTVWINVLSPGITSCAPCTFTCLCATPVTPVAQTVTSTKTGVYCFIYSGPTTPVANFVTLFTSGVAAVNKFTLPDGSYSSWFRLAPGLATITVLNNGDLICVAAPPGTAVFM